MYCQPRLLQIRYLITMTTFIFFLLPTLTFSYFGNSRECNTLTKLSFSWKTARLHISNWVHKQIWQGKAFSEVFSILRTAFNAMYINYFCRGICSMWTICSVNNLQEVVTIIIWAGEKNHTVASWTYRSVVQSHTGKIQALLELVKGFSLLYGKS